MLAASAYACSNDARTAKFHDWVRIVSPRCCRGGPKVNFYHSVLHALVALLFSACVLGAEPALAQASYPAGTDQKSVAGQPSSLPENLSREAIRDVLSGLDDAQVRELLLRELDEQAAERAAALAGEAQRSALDVAEDW